MFRHVTIRRTIAALLLLAAIAFLPQLVGLAQEQLQLGNMTYSRAAAPALRMPVTRSVRFFRGVGGVAFSAIAKGDAGLVVTGLAYDAAAPDGQRLLVKLGSPLGNRTARANLYDWELVPTAKFAMDENGSAVTLFGRLQDRDTEARALAAGGRIINYHPQLDKTLLGLRLFQADILIIQPDAADLFKRNGRVILGAGEGGHSLAQNMRRFAGLSEWQEQQRNRGIQYQSYVVGDLRQTVTFSVQNGSLAFTGEPYWNAWRYTPLSPSDQVKENELEQQYAALVAPYNALVQVVNGQLGAPAQPSAEQQKLAAMRKTIDGIETQLESLRKVEQMPAYSRELSRRIRELDGINPLVYRSVRTVMHYRALFKHYQAHDAAGFGAFVKSIAGVSISPAVDTPTIQTDSTPPR